MMRREVNASVFEKWMAGVGVDSKTFVGGVTVTTGANLIILAIGFGTGIVTARLLGADGRGELASIQLWPALVANVAVMGLPAAVSYYSGRCASYAAAYYTSALTSSLLVAGPLMIMTYWLLPDLLSAQSEATKHFAQLYLLFVPAGIVTGISLASLQGQFKLLLWNMLRLVAGCLWLVVVLLLTLVEAPTAPLVGSYYLVVVFVLATVYCVIVLSKTEGPITIGRRLIKRLYGYGIPSGLASLPEQANLRMDQLLIAAWMPPRMLGLYVVATAWASSMTVISNAISYVIVPHVSRLRSRKEQGVALARIVPGSLVVSMILAGSLALATPWGIEAMFGTEFRAAIPVAYVLIVGGVIASVKGVMAEGLRGLGRPRAAMAGELVGFVVSTFLLCLFLKPYGILGAAVISVLGSGTTLILSLILCSREAELKILRLLVPGGEEWRYVMRTMLRGQGPDN